MTRFRLARRWSVRAFALAAAIASVAGSRAARAQQRDSSARTPLFGRVVETRGAPVPGATVGVYGANDTTTTSDSGRFTLPHISPGPHMVWIRRLGFETTRSPVTVAEGRAGVVLFKMVRTVPLLPTVSTTALARAYHDVGLDRRMRAGIGQFLTYNQIEQRQANTVSQLLDQMRGIMVWKHPQNFEASVDGTRGIGSCVGFDIDGVPQTELYNPVGLPTDDADNLMDPAMVGAIEVYSSSERPLEFGPGREERPFPVPGTRPPVVDFSAQQCTLVVIWTKTRLGLLATDRQGTSRSHSDVRGDGVFPTGPSCEPPSAIDTTDVAVYATLDAGHAPAGNDTSWSRYAGRVLTALRSALVLPSELPLPAFGYPLLKGKKPLRQMASASDETLDVEPTLSAVASFTLDSLGRVGNPRIAVSSMSGAADTSLLAAIADAAATHSFPSAPAANGPGSLAHFDLIVSTVRPAVGDAATVIGRITVPVWPLTRRVALAAGAQPTLTVGSTGRAVDAVGPRLEFVVDQQGHVAMPSLRAFGATESEVGNLERDHLEALARALPELRFQPALVGACPVSQIATTGAAWMP